MTDQYMDYFPHENNDCYEYPYQMEPLELLPFWQPTQLIEPIKIIANEDQQSFETSENSQRKISFDDPKEDLNTKVDLIISNSRTFKKRKHADKKTEEPCTRVKKPKLRKNNEQVEILRKNYKPTWTKEDIVLMSSLTGLTQLQVYKWSWDQASKKVL